MADTIFCPARLAPTDQTATLTDFNSLIDVRSLMRVC